MQTIFRHKMTGELFTAEQMESGDYYIVKGEIVPQSHFEGDRTQFEVLDSEAPAPAVTERPSRRKASGS